LKAAAREPRLASNMAPAVVWTIRRSSSGSASPNWMAKVLTDRAGSGTDRSDPRKSSTEMPRLFSPSVISTIEVNEPLSAPASAAARW
jgi:hypothetical protein